MNISGKRLCTDSVMREIYLSRIIGGLIFDRETADNLCRKINISLPWNGFISAVIYFDEDAPALNGGGQGTVNAVLDEIYTFTPTLFEPRYKAYIAFNERYLNCLINLPQTGIKAIAPGSDADKTVRDVGAVMQRLADHIYDRMGIKLLITLGNAVVGLGEIRTSTDEAKAMLDYARLLGFTSSVMYFQDYATPPLHSTTIIQACLEKRIFNCARAGDYEGALATLHEVSDEFFYKSAPSIRVAECRFGAMKSMLINVLNDIQQDIGEEFFIEDRSISLIINTETLSSFLELADKLFGKIISATAEKRTQSIPSWLTPVREYINENYTDSNLNISTLAGLFGLNPSHLSNSFREHFGIGILEYIHMLRLSDAKLLLGQGLNLDSIAEQIGYSSTRTMSRAFAKYEGVTPGRLNRLSQDPTFNI